jgi:hypothetical protein
MVFMPNKSTPDYLFEKANQCFRRSRTDSNARVELEALGNEFMVEAIDLDIKLQNLAKGNYTASSPTRVGRLAGAARLDGFRRQRNNFSLEV